MSLVSINSAQWQTTIVNLASSMSQLRECVKWPKMVKAIMTDQKYRGIELHAVERKTVAVGLNGGLI